MSNIILKVENISKQYRLGVVGTGTLAHDLNRWWHKLRGKEDPYLILGTDNDPAQTNNDKYVWALKDINFEVKQGEVLGIIGRNGAGKSTLLKLLSRVTLPTSGVIKTKGKIASLLEVGTGFHPELTGKENVYLNGAILGMTKKEITAKYDEIVHFSGCAKYMETPVKRYSSGMRVRLAFAVAAHLEPDILIVDEVLAVGDAKFQKKALGKMKDISGNQGRTVLFVSHNMAAVKSLCDRALVLDKGKVMFNGDVDKSINFYQKMDNENGVDSFRRFNKNEFEGKDYFIHSFGIKAKNKNFGEPILRSDCVEFVINYTANRGDYYFGVFKLKDEQGNYIFVTGAKNPFFKTNTKRELKMFIPSNFFNQGNFYVDLHISNINKNPDIILDAVSFTIILDKFKLGRWMGKSVGPLKPDFDWVDSKIT